MNRQWVYDDRRSIEYIQGLRSFLNVAEASTRNGFMCCPCRVCRNEKNYSSSKILHIHPIQSGFMIDYNCWTKHGERGVMMKDNEEEENDYSVRFKNMQKKVLANAFLIENGKIVNSLNN